MGWLQRLLGTAERHESTPPVAQRIQPHPPRNSSDPSERWYVPSDDKERFQLDENGLPPLHLIPYRMGSENVLRLCEDSTGLLVGPTDRRLFALGIFSFNAVGESFHPGPCRSEDFSPGVRVRFVREPANPHDANAVAIRADQPGANTAAYVSKGHAKRLAKLLDANSDIEVVSVRGTGAGHPCEQISVVGASQKILAHLLSARSTHLPSPAHLK